MKLKLIIYLLVLLLAFSIGSTLALTTTSESMDKSMAGSTYKAADSMDKDIVVMAGNVNGTTSMQNETSMQNMGSGYDSIALSMNQTLVKNEIIIPMKNETEMEWRHIILKGNNTQIGMALGEIAQEDYGLTSLSKYADAVYGKARQEYMAKNFPTMLARMKGVAAAYGMSPENGSFDTTVLPYDIGSIACSMIYFPPMLTVSGHALSVRSMDFSRAPLGVYFNKTNNISGNLSLSRLFLLEIYPNKGYATMVIGGHDLNSMFDGLNSEGLAINFLEDPSIEPVFNTTVSGGRNSGMFALQMGRLVLETCRTVEEAKIAFLNNKQYLAMAGFHCMVSDTTGRSTIVEFNKDDGNIYFTDGNISQPSIMTNHPIFKYTTVAPKDLPRDNIIPYNHQHDTFNRYRTLYNFTSSHQGKFSEDDLANVLSTVTVNSILEYQGFRPYQVTTLYDVILDLSDRSLKVKCFLKSGDVDKATNEGTMVFTPYLTFKMDNSSF
jgi:hypothetical protein